MTARTSHRYRLGGTGLTPGDGGAHKKQPELARYTLEKVRVLFEGQEDTLVWHPKSLSL
jgi:hypothetical protein